MDGTGENISGILAPPGWDGAQNPWTSISLYIPKRSRGFDRGSDWTDSIYLVGRHAQLFTHSAKMFQRCFQIIDSFLRENIRFRQVKRTDRRLRDAATPNQLQSGFSIFFLASSSGSGTRTLWTR